MKQKYKNAINKETFTHTQWYEEFSTNDDDIPYYDVSIYNSGPEEEIPCRDIFDLDSISAYMLFWVWNDFTDVHSRTTSFRERAYLQCSVEKVKVMENGKFSIKIKIPSYGEILSAFGTEDRAFKSGVSTRSESDEIETRTYEYGRQNLSVYLSEDRACLVFINIKEEYSGTICGD